MTDPRDSYDYLLHSDKGPQYKLARGIGHCVGCVHDADLNGCKAEKLPCWAVRESPKHFWIVVRAQP